jgi:hypothetical protein
MLTLRSLVCSSMLRNTLILSLLTIAAAVLNLQTSLLGKTTRSCPATLDAVVIQGRVVHIQSIGQCKTTFDPDGF